jgi:Uma2 family endonuclease
VLEVVDRESADRDCQIKPAEYLAFGVAEYWIIDGQTRRMTVNTRWRGQWKPRVLKPSQKYATPLLPGFALDLKRVFAAGR